MPAKKTKKTATVKKAPAKKVAVKKPVVKKATVKKLVAKKAVVKKNVKKVAHVVATPKQQQMVSFGDAVANFFHKYFVFSGTAQRSEYWWVVLFNVMVYAVLSGIAVSLEFLVISPVWSWLIDVWNLFIFIPTIALVCRRFHDIGHSGKWQWFNLVWLVAFILSSVGLMRNDLPMMTTATTFAFVGLIWSVVALVWKLLPSKFENNKYRK